MIEYELLKIIWWVLVGVLLIGFALTDGFDMGSMAIMLESPHYELLQVFQNGINQCEANLDQDVRI
jgi:cytochrome bd-type quinol oxidase subunit 2